LSDLSDLYSFIIVRLALFWEAKMDLNQFLEIIRNMERKPFKPHRYLALMAILDIIESQEEPQNRFYYDDEYINYFTEHFHIYHGRNDRYNPFKPFFHLKNAGRNAGGFWFLSPTQGREAELNRLDTVGGPGELNEIVAYAELDQEIFKILSNKESGQQSREIVRNEIKQCLKARRQTNL
jgi:putative restriction endonuclease